MNKHLRIGAICFLFFHFFSFLGTRTVFASSPLSRYWKLDETSGTTASETLAGEDGSLQASPTWTAGKFGNALQFDSASHQYVNTSTIWPNNGTLSVWVNPTTGSNWVSPAGWKQAGGFHGYVLFDEGGSGDHWRAVFSPNVDDGEEVSITSDNSISFSSWQLLTMTWSYNSETGRYTVKFYVNGVPQNGGAGVTWLGFGIPGNQGGLNIGGQGDFGDNYYSGKVDEVRLYSQALTDGQVLDLLASPAIWTGGTSRDWSQGTNWDINRIPDSYSKVRIATATNQPQLSDDVTIDSLILNTGTSLDLEGRSFTLSGTDPVINNGTVILNNSEALTNFANDTTHGTVMYNNRLDMTALNLGNTYHSLIFNDGLVGYWKLDDSGDTVIDSSGYGDNGTVEPTSGTTPDATRIPDVHFANNRSRRFAGDEDILISPVPTSINSLTISAWVYPTSLSQHSFGAGGGLHGGTIIDANEDGGPNGYVLAVNESGQVWWWPQSGFDVRSDSTIPLNQWSHIVLTQSGSTARIYINGSLDHEQTDVASPQLPTFMKIGGKAWVAGSWVGNLDEVRIYDHVLTGSEISRMAAGNEPGNSVASTTLTHNLTVNKDLILNGGTLDATGSNYNLTVAGDFENNGGIFLPHSDTVTLNGTNQLINSSNNFFNLSKTVTSADTLTFGQSSTSTISGTLTLHGGNTSNTLALRSSTPGTQWLFNPQGTRSFSFLNPQDSNNINATEIAFSSGFTFGSNLTNWAIEGTDPTPDPSPSSSPAPESSGNSGENGSGNSQPAPQSCTDGAPGGTPQLFQINTTKNSATVYFTPTGNPTSYYYISYGKGDSTEEFGAQMDAGSSSGVQLFTINLLSPATEYSFKVRAGNGCKPGEWSNVMHSATIQGKGTRTTYPNSTAPARKRGKVRGTSTVTNSATTKPMTNPEPTPEPSLIPKVEKNPAPESATYTQPTPKKRCFFFICL